LLGFTVREAVMAVYLVAGALGLAGILLTVAGFKSGMTLVALLIAGGIVAGYKLEQVYRQQSAGSHQLSAVSHQPTADGSASSAANRQPATLHSQRDADG
jgi:hypothetical protein